MTDTPVQISYGQQRLDSTGLFIQWLAEGIQSSFPERPFEIRLRRWPRPPEAVIELEVSSSMDFTADRAKLAWPVGALNGFLEADNGRGGLLRTEVQVALHRLRHGLYD